MYVFLHVILYLDKAVTKLSPKLANVVPISSSGITILLSGHRNFVITMVTE